MINISVGQILNCKNGETVIVREVSQKEIQVEYKGKLYIRPRDIIGKKLFVIKKVNTPKLPHTPKKTFSK